MDDVNLVAAGRLSANADRYDAGEKEVTVEIDCVPWTQSTFSYQAKCLCVLRESFAALSAVDQAAARAALDGTGCEAFTTVA